MKKIHARQLILKIFIPWPKTNSYKEFDNEKKFLHPKNSPQPSPPPPPHNFSYGLSFMIKNSML